MLTRRALLPVLAAIPMRRRVAPEAVPRTPETRIVLGGDVMLSRFVGRLARAWGDPAFPFRDLAPLLAAADIAFVNLEAPFSDHGNPLEEGMVFKSEPEMIAGLELAGIDVVSTANNHARDCGSHGVEFTLDWLARHGIAAVGTGRSERDAHTGAVLTRNGVRFGFLAYTFNQTNGIHTDLDPRIAGIDVASLRQDLAGLLARADVAIVSMHAGVEYAARPNRQQIEFARAAINAGARVVVGHHPHVVQRWERIGDGVVFYSLGNLVFDQSQRVETQHGGLAEIIFRGRTIVHAALLSVDIVATAPRLAAATPAPATGGPAARGAG
jgi:poly-gamma-glutamate capsule biosynthesis protein CapA/YwtB (metallophosphatase superfamily)